MAAISTAIAAVAATAAVAGTAYSIYGANKQSKAQEAAAQSQAIVGGLQASATGLQQQSLGIQTQQQELGIATQRKAIELQQQQDDIRRQAASLDATRRTRDMIRTGIVARGQALATATAQGAADSGSSAVAGAEGTISGRVGNNLLGVYQNQQLGNSIFDLNRSISANYINAQDVNAGFVQKSQGLQSGILDIQRQIYQQGGQTSLNYKDAAAAGGITAFGTGLTSLGGALVKNQEAMTNLGNFFSSTFGGGGKGYVSDPTFGGYSSSGTNAWSVRE